LFKGGERMRKCIRCDTEMIEDLAVKTTMNLDCLRVCRANTTGTLPKNFFGEVKAAVCPQCGYLETYVTELDRIRKNMTGN